jgi:hypothetical protein
MSIRSKRVPRSPFCILSVLGDLLDGGELHFGEAVPTLEDAGKRIKALAGSTPGQYVIYNGETGERVSIVAA